MIYAIGVESKRHAIYTKGAPLGDEDFRLVEADDDGWIGWCGGECPLPKNAPFQVLYADGKMKRLNRPQVHHWQSKADRSGCRKWAAYRPILDTSPEAPAWDGEGLPPVGCECDCYHTGTHQGVVTVRYMGREMCVLLNHDHGEEQCGPIDAYAFRPIRSAAQQAEEALMDAYMEGAKGHMGGIAAIYAAIRDGKVPGVKLENP